MVDAAFAVLTSERLVLRRFRPEDLDAFVAYRSDPEVARYQRWEAPYPAGQARRFLQELQALLIERGKHRVRATCDDRNTRSAAVLERVGMRREGHLLESTWSKGEWTSDLLYAVLRREWPAGR
jgi:RimJ/RimL family protein N-acetyltransferase